MKKILASVAMLAAVVLTGCASTYPVGALYQELKLPVTATSAKSINSKKGYSEATSILGLVATGDASIEAAAKQGGITVIHHVDWEVKNILGIIGTYRCNVYGE